MFTRTPLPARQWAALIAVVALASVLAQAASQVMQTGSPPIAVAWEMARFFTILTNLLVVLTLGRVALQPARPGAPWLAALTLSIVMVGAVYHTLLAHLLAPSGLAWWADQGLHTGVPLMLFGWWLLAAPKRRLTWGDLPLFALWPAVYMVYALWRGARDGIYPYPFMNPVALGAAEVAVNLAGLLIMLLLGGIAMISIGRFADR